MAENNPPNMQGEEHKSDIANGQSHLKHHVLIIATCGELAIQNKLTSALSESLHTNA